MIIRLVRQALKNGRILSIFEHSFHKRASSITALWFTATRTWLSIEKGKKQFDFRECMELRTELFKKKEEEE